MTITYGLTTTGLVVKTLSVIRAEREALLRAAFGNGLPLGDKTFFGQVVGIEAEREAAIWDLIQAVNASQDPDAATAAALDALCRLTGTIRTPASYSTTTLTLCGVPTTAVASGTKVASVTTPTTIFATSSLAVITLLASWTNTTAYALGDRVTNASRCYQCITAGSSASAPTGTALDITDGSVHWEYIGDGTGAIDAPAVATATGALAGVSRDITNIITPVGGLSTAINLLDAVQGSPVQSDASLRLTREAELAADGDSTADAIRGKLLKVAGVTSVTVFVNNTDVVNADGMPPHSVECLVLTPTISSTTDDAIRAVIFANVAAGIVTVAGLTGGVTGTVVDSAGVTQTVNFTRPTQIPIYVDVTLTYDALTYPADGDAQIKAAIAAYGLLGACGRDARAASLGAQAFTVAGVLDVPRSGALGGCLISTAPGPTSDATIAVSTRQLATYDTGRITVHSTPGTP